MVICILFMGGDYYLLRRSRHKVTGLQGHVCCKLATGSAFSRPVP
jgi:hypothetical protein